MGHFVFYSTKVLSISPLNVFHGKKSKLSFEVRLSWSHWSVFRLSKVQLLFEWHTVALFIYRLLLNKIVSLKFYFVFLLSI